MQKIFLLVVVLSFLVAAPGVLAQETELPSPGLTPDSPFYFLERISEGIGTFFTFGDLKKAERHATLAAERLAEAKAVAEKGKSELAEKTLQRYENQLNNSIARAEKAQAEGQNTEKVMEVMTIVGQATSKHLEVLAEVYEKVPEQAKPAIENAMKVSVKGHEKAVEALKAQNALGEVPEEAPLPEKIPQEVRKRVQMRVQKELEKEKVEQLLQKGFESFESLKTYCIEEGGAPELCASLEAKCKEVGATTPDECFRAMTTAVIKSRIIQPLSEEEMEAIEKRRIEAEEASRKAEEGISSNSGGIGAEISIRNSQLTILGLLEDSPAEKAGLRAGDKILAINGENITGIAIEDAVTKISGKIGTNVVLTILRLTDDEEISLVVSVTRAYIAP